MKVFTGEAPFGRDKTPAVIIKAMAGKLPERPTHPDFNDRLWTLTLRCLERKPSDRPNMEQVLEELKDIGGSRGASPGRVGAQPSKMLKGDTDEKNSRRTVGNISLKKRPEAGRMIPRAVLLLNLIDRQRSNCTRVVVEKSAKLAVDYIIH